MKFARILIGALFLLAIIGPFLPLRSESKNPHGQMKLDCETCHSTASWEIDYSQLKFDHKETGYILIGGHTSADCRSCHKDLKFSNTGVQCADCHTDIHRNQFGQDCQSCHTPHDWRDRQDMLSLHAQRGFQLVGVHAIVDCDACHIRQGRDEFAGTPVECQGCHLENFNTTSNPNHAQANFSQDCMQCHLPTASRWQDAHFQHGAQFELTGAHLTAECSECHAISYEGMSQECLNCHQNNYDATSDPAHQELGFPTDCQRCHGQVTWDDAEFDHVQASGFELRGAHAIIDCNSCHANNQYTLPRECFGCHQNDYQNVTDPSHTQGNFPQDCLVCHNETAWEPAQFNHDLSSFPLTGQHRNTNCTECHINNIYDGTPTDCWSCHQNDFPSDHADNNFDHDCTICHNTNGWEDDVFSHNNTDFPLTGAHTAINCISCHADGYISMPTDCFSCHASDYNNVTDPNHVQNNFDQNCVLCHNTVAWEPATFNHANTQFPLTGAHVSLNCIQCHANGYDNTPSECYACHQSDYEGVTDPNHVQNNFDQNCVVCHNTVAWEPATFDHANTNFPLTGAHVSLNCIQCHANGYDNTPTECYACHQSDYEGVTDPNHVQNNFDQNCVVCHNTVAWEPATFDHANTQFPLTGAHVSLNCIQCHANGYDNTPSECYACHQSDYEGVTDPNHVQNNFDQNCVVCHNTIAWEQVTFDHANTNFPLTGAHVSLNCIECHANGYDNTPSECYACHQSDYEGVTDPNHVQNNFDQNCVVCHNTVAWEPATFDHANTDFPLTGAHVSLNCIQCHANGYDNTPSECYACHQSDYEGVTDPNHVQNNFDQNCVVCHNTVAWEPATFDHANTDFPLTGAHVSLNCIECHANGYDNTPTDCWSCHSDDYNNVDDPDHAGNNYSHDCTQCHNTTDWDEVSFDHNQTSFPLTGQHLAVPCIECHANGYNNTPIECLACHQSDYNIAVPDHNIGYPETCEDCHNTNGWDQSNFNHDAQFFPIYSGRHQQGDEWNVCADCHINSNDFNQFECILCHEHNRPDTDGDHDEVPNYDYNSDACYDCHPDGEN